MIHERAEARRDVRAAVRYEALLRAHHRGQYSDYLKGQGTLTLDSEPTGAAVDLYRYVERDRRLVPQFEGTLGRTPLTSASLPMGSYLLVIRGRGRCEVRCPIVIERQGHWAAVAPMASATQPVYLPHQHELSADEVYVPAGWFWCGGDPSALGSLPRRRLWIDGFFIGRFPVTNRQYMVFLDDLVAQRREEEALRVAPRERSGTPGQLGALLYGRDGEGMFVLQADSEGDIWQPDWPVIQISYWAARAYSEWLSQRTEHSYRLPSEWEWEKAARGVDERHYPWGDFHDPAWCCMRDSHTERPQLAVVESHPVDESPYGVRGMSGNVLDWCLDTYRKPGPMLEGDRLVLESTESQLDPSAQRVFRGGCWGQDAQGAKLAKRNYVSPDEVGSYMGFRMVRASRTSRYEVGE